MDYSKSELVDMVYVLGESQKNCLLAQRLYRMKYPARRQPTRLSFENLMERFASTGSVDYVKRKVVNKKTSNQGKELEILLHIEENPHVSSRQIAAASETSQSTVNRTTRKYKYHPYHIELHQELRNDDFERRVNFCQWISAQLEINPNFLSYIMFSDEATFRSNGAVNRHNMHYYALDNPFWIRRMQNQNHWSINVWCGILHNRIIGLYFSNTPLSGRIYLQFLQEVLPNLLHLVNDNDRQSMWLQQDGAPPHYHREVREFLDNNYPQKWIGRGGFVQWPPRSCDLTPLDFFLWGYIKDRVYVTSPTTREDMEDRIRDACGTITPEMLGNLRQNMIKRVNVCIQQEGHLFEHILRTN